MYFIQKEDLFDKSSSKRIEHSQRKHQENSCIDAFTVRVKGTATAIITDCGSVQDSVSASSNPKIVS